MAAEERKHRAGAGAAGAARPLVAAPGAQEACSARFPGTGQSVPRTVFRSGGGGAGRAGRVPAPALSTSRVAHFLSRVGLNVDSAPAGF